MARKCTFSPSAIDALRKGLLADPKPPGLALEALPSGKKCWRYRRLVAGTKTVATLFGALFPLKRWMATPGDARPAFGRVTSHVRHDLAVALESVPICSMLPGGEWVEPRQTYREYIQISVKY